MLILECQHFRNEPYLEDEPLQHQRLEDWQQSSRVGPKTAESGCREDEVKLKSSERHCTVQGRREEGIFMYLCIFW